MKKTSTTRTVTTKGPTKQMWRRSVVLLLIVFVLGFSLLVSQLIKIQVFEKDKWENRALKQQFSDIKISASRGSIYDVNGEILAKSADVWTVVMSPKDIPDEATRVKIADELSVMLDTDRDKLYEQTTKANFQYIEIKKKIEYEKSTELVEWIKTNKVAGIIWLISDFKRYYPQSELLSQVIGFIGDENTGLFGIEAKYENELSGVPGRVVTSLNGVGDEMPIKMSYEKRIGAEEGNSLILTIDSTVQRYVEKHLENAVAESAAKNRAVAIVMNVNTGAIVAMSTKGDFDLNSPWEIKDSALSQSISELAGDTKSTEITKALNAQWSNKALTSTYYPGSVFKVFTAAMALEENRVNRNTHFYCSGVNIVAGVPIRCHKKGGHGSITFDQAVSVSCNPAFMEMGRLLGRTNFAEYHKAFGFTQKTGIDMIGEFDLAESLFFTEARLNEVELATASFGQNFSVTPMQMIAALSAVANGGKLVEPYVVEKVVNSEGSVVSSHQTKVKRQVISEETSKILNEILYNTTVDGGSRNAYVAGYRMAGKTGTSEKIELKNQTGRDEVVASFAGYAPADSPEYAIIVMVDEPGVTPRFGSTIAAPVAQKIMSDILPYLGVEPNYSEKEAAELERRSPNLVGKTVAEAQALINSNNLNIKIVGEGTTVLKQVPEAETKIPSGGTVVVYTSEEELKRTTAVPSFVGQTLSQARQTALSHNLNIQIVGIEEQNENPIVTSQSTDVGDVVPLGTIIEVSIVYTDAIQ